MSYAADSYRTLDDWITAEAIALATESDDAFNHAVDAIVAALGGDRVQLLGFGEALHGGEAILMLRNRLFKRLVEAHGYVAIAMESSFARGPAMNDYIRHRGAATTYDDAQHAGFSHGFGDLEANRELMDWMRQHNATTAADRPELHYYGFDQPAVTAGPASPRQVLHVALDYLAAVDESAAARHRDRIESLLGDDAAWENPMTWRDPEQSKPLIAAATSLRIETEYLMSTLQTRRPHLIDHTDAQRYAEAAHHITAARQLLNFYAALSGEMDQSIALGVRDAMMGDNLAYIVDREQPRGKVMVFAHNAHLQRHRVQVQMGPMMCEWWPAGSQIARTLGDGYAVIGTGVGQSADNGIAPAEPDTLEAKLLAAADEIHDDTAVMIPTHRAPALPADVIATTPGRSRSNKNPSFVPLSGESIGQFDALAILAATSYQRGGRRLA